LFGQTVHDASRERGLAQSGECLYKYTRNAEKVANEREWYSRPGSRAQYHVRTVRPQDSESLIEIHEEQPVALGVPNEKGPVFHVFWDYDTMVENVEMVVFLVS
jgi:hypothetical protein